MYVFLAHWCPHCNDEIPELIALDENGDIPENLAIVGISTAVAPDRDNYPPSEWLADRCRGTSQTNYSNEEAKCQ